MIYSSINSTSVLRQFKYGSHLQISCIYLCNMAEWFCLLAFRKNSLSISLHSFIHFLSEKKINRLFIYCDSIFTHVTHTLFHTYSILFISICLKVIGVFHKHFPIFTHFIVSTYKVTFANTNNKFLFFFLGDIWTIFSLTWEIWEIFISDQRRKKNCSNAYPD